MYHYRLFVQHNNRWKPVRQVTKHKHIGLFLFTRWRIKGSVRLDMNSAIEAIRWAKRRGYAFKLVRVTGEKNKWLHDLKDWL